MNQPAAEMHFGRDDSPSETIVSSFTDTGQITITVHNTEVEGHACDNELTLGQAISLRDFLNRHIDGLALAATGSLAVRSSDDPAQLAAEELLATQRAATLGDNPTLNLDEMEQRIGVLRAGCGTHQKLMGRRCGDGFLCARCAVSNSR